MNIGVDAGGLCVKQGYGNYIFTVNLLHAITQFDKVNNYTAYTFCDSHPFQNRKFIYRKLLPKIGWMKLRVTVEEFLNQKGLFLALNQAFPPFTHGKIIAFSHGLSFIRRPDFYKRDFSRLKKQLDEYLKKSDVIVTTSIKVEQDLYKYYPKLNKRVLTLLPGIPYDFQSYQFKKRKKYLLFVGMNHQIKNVDAIIRLYLKIKKESNFKDYQLYLVGHFEEYKSKDIHIFPKISRARLKVLYQEAYAYISMSCYESFNFPVLEALSQKCPVVALETAVIPEIKKFVNLAKNDGEFIKILKRLVMLNSIQHPNKIAKKDRDDNELKTLFSWEKYVTCLRTLYNEL